MILWEGYFWAVRVASALMLRSESVVQRGFACMTAGPAGDMRCRDQRVNDPQQLKR